MERWRWWCGSWWWRYFLLTWVTLRLVDNGGACSFVLDGTNFLSLYPFTAMPTQKVSVLLWRRRAPGFTNSYAGTGSFCPPRVR